MIPLAIKAAGMVTAVGFNAASSCAAMRAGISGVKQSGLWDHSSGKFISAAKVSLPHWWEGLGKLAELVSPAIHECLATVESVPHAEIALILGVAGRDRPHRLGGLEEELFERVGLKLDVRFHRESRIVSRGHVSGVVGIQEAARLIDGGLVRYCIVAGVDSYLQQEVVRAYIDERRILTPRNSNGFIPGEGGGAVLIGPVRQDIDELRILGWGTGWEEATITSGKPLRGDGLTQAIRDAISKAKLSLSDFSYRITDLNGEHYKFKEASFATTRFQQKVRDQLFDLWHPIECTGELGASVGPCVLAVAMFAGRKGYAPGHHVLCHFSDDDGERAAVALGFVRRGGN